MAAIASMACWGRSAWIPERNVPGHTQLTRIPSRAYSTAATFASWMTAAFVAQYGPACDHAVSPATDAVNTIDPDRCGRMTATALSCIPIAVAILMFYTNPDYVKFFFTDDIGNIMLGAAIFLQVVGYLIMKKIVNIEV